MFRLGDSIPSRPDTNIPGTLEHRSTIGRGKVVYIHPAGHYYTLEFQGTSGTFRESRNFSEAELAEGSRAGLFPKMDPSRLNPEVIQPVAVAKAPQGCCDPVFF